MKRERKSIPLQKPAPKRIWGAVVVLALLAPPPTPAQEINDRIPIFRPESSTTGELHVVVDGQVRVLDFPLERTEVDCNVSGLMSSVVVRQHFQNPYNEPIEAVYVFPLPHEAAVNAMTMNVGKRVVKAVIERREAARQIYEAAKQKGAAAALLEQERPNIFTQSVANIRPREAIVVELTYVEMLVPRDGTTQLVFPTVVGPRYSPAGMSTGSEIQPASSPGLGGDPWDQGFDRPVPSPLPHPMPIPFPTPRVPDADRLEPDYLPKDVRSSHEVDIRVDLDAGFTLGNLKSPSHSIGIQRRGDDRAVVTLRPADRIPNKDFVLSWETPIRDPEAAVFTSSRKGEGYLSLLLQPEENPLDSEVIPREIFFVLDCSGSMNGEPIAKSKALVRRALSELQPNDTFQISRFSFSASSLAPAPLTNTPENLRRATGYLEGLESEGGTEMLYGIRAALEGQRDPRRLRVVMFLTDGYIGNESEILSEVQRLVGEARIFSFGIGSSVNRHLLEEMSREGRGVCEIVLLNDALDESVHRFAAHIRRPEVTDLAIDWGGLVVEDVIPSRLPDLFEGRPVLVQARTREGGSGRVTIEGRRGGRAWRRTIKVDVPRRDSGNRALGTLWARARIGDLERSMLQRTDNTAEDEITNLGLRHELVTQYTSFVAFEETCEVIGGRPKTVRIPVNLPEGVSEEGVFGEGRLEEITLQGMTKPRSVATTGENSLSHSVETRALREPNVTRGHSSSETQLSIPNNAPAPSSPPNGAGGAVHLDGQLVVRGGRSTEVKTMTDGLPVSDSFSGPAESGNLGVSNPSEADLEKPNAKSKDEQMKGREVAAPLSLNLTLVPGQDLVLEFVLENPGNSTVAMPDLLSAGANAVPLTLVLADGQTILWAEGVAVKPRIVSIGPGQRVTRVVRISAAALDKKGVRGAVQVQIDAFALGQAQGIEVSWKEVRP